MATDQGVGSSNLLTHVLRTFNLLVHENESILYRVLFSCYTFFYYDHTIVCMEIIVRINIKVEISEEEKVEISEKEKVITLVEVKLPLG